MITSTIFFELQAGRRCEFEEEQESGHFRYKSVFGGWVLGFNRRGKPLIDPVNENCSKFLKMNSTLDNHLTRHQFNIDEHNRKVGHQQTPPTPTQHKRRHGNKSHNHIYDRQTRSQRTADSWVALKVLRLINMIFYFVIVCRKKVLL